MGKKNRRKKKDKGGGASSANASNKNETAKVAEDPNASNKPSLAVDDDECLICLDEVVDPIHPCEECNRPYCRKCIDNLKRRGGAGYRDKCPNCRTKLSDTEAIIMESNVLYVRWEKHGKKPKDPVLVEYVAKLKKVISMDPKHALALYNLGVLYRDGEGVKQSYKEAARLFRLAGDQGYALAQCNLGDSYYKGAGVKQDYKEAVRLYRLAADQGYVEA